DAHALLGDAADDRRPAGLDEHGGAAVDAHLHRAFVAEGQQGLAGDDAFLLAAAGEMAHTAERQHLRAVLGGPDMADLLVLYTYRGLLGADVAVGVDLPLDAAIAEDALGDDGDHVDAVGLGRHDEGRRLVVGIGGTGTDAGDEGVWARHQVAVPGLAKERHE